MVKRGCQNHVNEKAKLHTPRAHRVSQSEAALRLVQAFEVSVNGYIHRKVTFNPVDCLSYMYGLKNNPVSGL